MTDHCDIVETNFTNFSLVIVDGNDNSTNTTTEPSFPPLPPKPLSGGAIAGIVVSYSDLPFL